MCCICSCNNWKLTSMKCSKIRVHFLASDEAFNHIVQPSPLMAVQLCFSFVCKSYLFSTVLTALWFATMLFLKIVRKQISDPQCFSYIEVKTTSFISCGTLFCFLCVTFSQMWQYTYSICRAATCCRCTVHECVTKLSQR